VQMGAFPHEILPQPKVTFLEADLAALRDKSLAREGALRAEVSRTCAPKANLHMQRHHGRRCSDTHAVCLN
jgi:hypothetical protein